MQLSELTIRIILLFLPGVICWFFLEKLIISRKREFSYFIIYSFLLAFLSYFTYYSIVYLLKLIPALNTPDVKFFSLLLNLDKPLGEGILFEIFLVSLTAFLLALGLSLIINNRIFHKIFLNKISRRFPEPDLWSFIFNRNDKYWIDLRDFKNKKIYRGQIFSYSDTISSIVELYLTKVKVYEEDGGEEYEVPGLYIARNSDDITIEFIRKVRS